MRGRYGGGWVGLAEGWDRLNRQGDQQGSAKPDGEAGHALDSEGVEIEHGLVPEM
jgi:hypothetical protein